MSRPPSKWRMPSCRRCPPTSPSWSRRSPTGGSSRRRPSSRKATARRKLEFVPTRDILAELGASDAAPAPADRLRRRDRAAWSSKPIAKRNAKRADWIVANDVSGDVMGGHRNRVHLITADGVEDWPDAQQGRGRAHSDRARCAGARLSRRPGSAGSARDPNRAPARASRRRTGGACPPDRRRCRR